MKYPLLNFSLFSSSLSQISICDENQCEISPEHPLGPCPSTNYVCRDQCVGYSCDCKEWLESRHFISTFDIASASHFSSISWFVQSIFVIRRIRFQPSVSPAVFLIHSNWRIAVAFLWRSKSNFCLFLIIFKINRCNFARTEEEFVSRIISSKGIGFFSPVEISFRWIRIANFIELQIALLFSNQLLQNRVLVHLVGYNLDKLTK